LAISSWVILDDCNKFFQSAGSPVKAPLFASNPTWTLCEKLVGVDIPSGER
jgi:hypothetical protein